ncbi:MAG TPA: LysR substrate-binding domain-containing protein [Woeseiaceae bacterium]|nr:LysR substrate-binding domain-containing protein [Woeseiaceae bacterium]
MPRTPPLNTLRAFEAAARHGSFVRAGQELNVTAAAISHRVKALEARLGVELFLRKPRGVALTEPGRRYRERVAAAFNLIEQATADIDQATVDGPLSVSMPQSLAEHWLAPRLGRLAARCPGLALSIEGNSRLRDLHDGQADASIRFGPGSYAGLDSHFLCGDAVSVLAPAAAVQALSDTRPRTLLEDATLLLDYGATPGEPWLVWPPWLREAGLAAGADRRTVRCADSSIAISACRAGAGFCIARLSFAFEYVQRRELAVLFPWRGTAYGHYLVTRPADRDNPRIAAFRAWLAEETARFADDAWRRLRVELPRAAQPA